MGLLIHDLSPEEWKKISGAMDLLARAIDSETKTYDINAGPDGFPKWLFIMIANTNWNRTAKQNGISPEDLYRRRTE